MTHTNQTTSDRIRHVRIAIESAAKERVQTMTVTYGTPGDARWACKGKTASGTEYTADVTGPRVVTRLQEVTA